MIILHPIVVEYPSKEGQYPLMDVFGVLINAEKYVRYSDARLFQSFEKYLVVIARRS